MRKSRRRLVIPLAVFSLIAAGGIAAGLAEVAHAQTEITTCTSGTTTDDITCSITDSDTSYNTTVDEPSSIQAVVTLTTPDTTTTDDQDVQITYTVLCSQGSNEGTTFNPADDNYAINTSSPVTDTLTLAYADPDQCEVESLTATLEATDSSSSTGFTDDTTGAFTMELEWTPQAAASTSSSSSSSSSVDVAYISGWGSKCIDDRGNSSSNGAQVIIWGCNHGDSAQSWSWTGYELQHDGMCVNDPAYGGSGTKLILWSCNGASNEKWSHVSGGVFKLYYSSKGQLCLDDPGFSTTNGTRLMVYTCNNGDNQHWSRS